MERLQLRQLGEYDATFDAAVEPGGRYRVEGGGYVTRGAREGRLSPTDHARLVALAEAVLALPGAEAPEGAEGFRSTLTAGDRTARWWGPPPTAAHWALVNALAALGA